MVYVPPKYPGQIPTLEDLPDRQDDVDWLVAARYNELKKELRAALTELGTLPKGEYADVKTRLDAGVAGFTDRGDPGASDWLLGDLIEDNAYHDLDLSAIVPAGAKAVLLFTWYKATAVAKAIYFKTKGNVNAIAVSANRTVAAGLHHLQDHVVACDENRVIEYKMNSPESDYVDIVVKGWWM